MGSGKVEIVTDVTENEIPALLSNASMKAVDTTKSFANDRVNIIKWICSSLCWKFYEIPS